MRARVVFALALGLSSGRRSGAAATYEAPLDVRRDGLAYLRSITEVARFDSATWKEFPFDYGQEGIGYINGIGMDKDDFLYLQASARPLLGDGKPYPNPPADTLLKIDPRTARIVVAGEGRFEVKAHRRRSVGKENSSVQCPVSSVK